MRPSKLKCGAAVALAASCLTLATATPALAQDTVPDGGSSYAHWPKNVPRPAPAGAVPAPGGPSPPPGVKREDACMQRNSGNGTTPGSSWAQNSLAFQQAWPLVPSQGKHQKVAVIDTGVNPHPMLGGRVSGGPDGVNPADGSMVDCDGHGTMVAGIIASHDDQQTGFTGVAPQANILSIRQNSGVYQRQESGSDGSEGVGSTRTMAQAVSTAVSKGATVINISAANCEPIRQAATGHDGSQLRAALDNAKKHNVVVVAAAGNSEEQCSPKNAPGNPKTAVLPAWFDDDVLTVAASNEQGGPASFSMPGPWVDVAAPGTNLTSLDPGKGGTGLATTITEPGEQKPTPIQGTSFAAPYVSGLVALVKERFPDLKPDQVMDRVKETAQHPGGAGGRNDLLGYGVIDPVAALSAVMPANSGQGSPPAAHRLQAPLVPGSSWTPTLVALVGAGGGVGILLATMFLINARRRVRARRQEEPQSKLRW